MCGILAQNQETESCCDVGPVSEWKPRLVLLKWYVKGIRVQKGLRNVPFSFITHLELPSLHILQYISSHKEIRFLTFIEGSHVDSVSAGCDFGWVVYILVFYMKKVKDVSLDKKLWFFFLLDFSLKWYFDNSKCCHQNATFASLHLSLLMSEQVGH